MVNRPVLILPGLGGSGPGHWQSTWEASDSSLHRVTQRNWDHPDFIEWVATLQEQISACEMGPIMVAYSLACCLVAH